MVAILSSIFAADVYDTREDQLRARFVYALIATIMVLSITIGPIGVDQGLIFSPILPVGVFILGIVVYGLVRLKLLAIASWLLVVASIGFIIANNIGDGSVGNLTIVLSIFVLVMSGFLLRVWGLTVVAIGGLFQLLLFPIVQESSTEFLDRVPVAVAYLAITALVYAYTRFIEASRLTGQDIESVERLKLAEVTAQVTQQASTRQSLNVALNNTLKLILDNYPTIYHTQVFLIDDKGIQAKLQASTGDVGQTLLAREHSLAVGSLSVIGQTTFTGEAVVAISGDKDSVHRINELLPETSLEAAFPLRVEDDIIGALDLQSKVLTDLSENDRLTFQSIANSLSLAIDSIRQFEDAKMRLEENQRLAEQTRTALREVERLNQRLIGRAWADYVDGVGDNLGFTVNFEADETSPYSDWTPTLADAISTKNLVQANHVIAIPLRVRGQVIGAMEFELNENQDFTPEDLEFVSEVSERFGLAVENTRLVEESQRTAQRETLINQITSNFQSSQTVEATLAEAARSLNEVLNTDKVKIRLGLPESAKNGHHDGNGKDV